MLRRLAERNNPHLADELAKVNAGYANFKRLERAASYVGAEDGVFSPANLQSAVKALDRSKDHGRFARGDAYMQDLSDAAKTVLGNKVPDSGTAGRLFLGGGALLGGGAMSPAIPAALGAGAAAYSSPLQGLLVHLAATRPQAAQPIAGLLQQAAPVMAPAGGLLSLQAFQ